ncbi:hypothetical protein [Leptospira sp. GIMC2001]|uniref:hypothetical protein n=1 Tax=Leptospira sp. GIMC2001 TaxID=1513297 RepID=UPI00234BB92C|nr:hypothetical protein [Leptospira sp. GIMC2001]WCL49428.1 hypothetical protein O4O04_19390 [Leptospira sp. GIMC2001]
MPGPFPLNTATVNECLTELKKIQETKEFKSVIDLMTDLAISNDKNTWSVIYQIMRDADSGRLSWALHKEILSSTISILTKVGDSKSYRLIINYIKTLDKNIPFGAIELISDLLPTFAEMDPEEIIKIASQKDEIRSAIGIIALSKLAIENKLSSEQKVTIRNVFSDNNNQRFYMKDIIESTLHIMEDQEKGASFLQGEDLEKIFS